MERGRLNCLLLFVSGYPRVLAFNDICTIRFLRENGLDALIERYRISARRHREFPHLVLLKYSQIESPMHEAIVQECRGLIVDESADWAVVCRAYDKFFNHGEPHAAAIDRSLLRPNYRCFVYPIH